jgi:BirA family transcriptional regulator, biotin operon repressor / biotin---[acetyl-CoA-carboxylase] ligase
MSQVETSDRLVADDLQADLSGKTVIGREVIVLQQTGSTNDAVLEMARDLKEGFVLFAEQQTAGRGQRGNRWESPARKGLWFSILLRPKIDIHQSASLTAWAAGAVANTIQEEFSLKPNIKLPNDVRLDGRKVAGVLVEMRAQERAAHLAIVGIGINVNQSKQDFPEELRDQAISLAIALDRQVDRQRFAVAVLRNLDQAYRESLPPQFCRAHHEVISRSHSR